MKKLLSLFSTVLLGAVAAYGLAASYGEEARKESGPMRAPALSYGSLYGSIYDSGYSSPYNNGVFILPTSSSGAVTECIRNVQALTAFIDDGKYYGLWVSTSNSNPTYCLYDLATGSQVTSNFTSTDRRYTNFGIDKDPVTGDIYGVFYESSTSYGSDSYKVCLAKVTFSGITPTLEVVGTLNSQNWYGFSINSKGEMYGICAETGANAYLYKIDPSSIQNGNVAMTQIGDTGYKSYNRFNTAFDRSKDVLYWTCNVNNWGSYPCYITTVDLTTGKATPVYTFEDNEKVAGLAFLDLPYAGNAPAACENVTAEFTDGALSGNIRLTTPSTFFNGETGSGQMTVNVTVDGENVGSTVTSQWGQEISIPVSVQTSGEYTFVITAENEAGAGEPVSVTLFVGEDTYEAPNVSLSYDFNEGKMKLSWTLEGVNGGWIDTDDITYTITRYPGAVQVQTGYSGNEYSEAFEAASGVKVYYEVVAVKNGVSSPAGKSNEFSFDFIDTYPHTDVYSYLGNLDGYTIIDANNDGTTWGWDSYSTRQDGIVCSYNTKAPMDDWFITKGHKLDAGKTYNFTFRVRANSSSYPERIEVKYGSTPTVAGMVTQLVEKTDVDWTTYANSPVLEATITPEATGIYYIGFHGCSDEDQSRLILGGYTIEVIQSEEPDPEVEPIEPPYTSDFGATELEGYTVINADGDEYEWEYYDYYSYEDANDVMVLSDYDSAKDDWLITPAFKLEKGATYTFSMTVKAGGSTSETMEVKCGGSNTVDAMVNTVIETVSFKSSEGDKVFSGTFTPEEDGIYYFGMHANTTSKYADDITLKAYSLIKEESTVDPEPDPEVEGIEPPYTSDFGTTELEGYTVIDSNGDGDKWEYYDYYSYEDANDVMVLSDYDSAKDDWLITPAFKLEKGATYTFSMTVKAGSSTAETMEVKCGGSNTVDAMVNTVIETASFKNSEGDKVFSGTFTPEEDGIYYFGMHANTTSKYADDITLKAYSLTKEESSVDPDPDPEVEGIEPPYTSDFGATQLDGHTVIGADGDDNEWEYYNYYRYENAYDVIVLSDYSSAKDDWLITPAFNLTAGSTYVFSMTVKAGSSTSETMEVKCGSSNTVDAMVNTVIETASFKSSDGDKVFSGTFTPEEDGIFYFGMHANTSKAGDDITLKSYSVVEETYPAPMNVMAEQQQNYVLLFWSEPIFTGNESVTRDHLVGYKVYKNQELKTDGHIAEKEYVDAETVTSPTEHVYGVSAIYSRDGQLLESKPEETTFNVTTSVGKINGGMTVQAVNSCIVVSNAEDLDINIFTASGVAVYSGKGALQTMINVQPGLYIVTVGGTSYKLFVK